MSGDGTGASGLGPAHDLDGTEDPRQETGELVRQAEKRGFKNTK